MVCRAEIQSTIAVAFPLPQSLLERGVLVINTYIAGMMP